MRQNTMHTAKGRTTSIEKEEDHAHEANRTQVCAACCPQDTHNFAPTPTRTVDVPQVGERARFLHEGRKTHGPAVFIEGCTMKAWVEVSPTITEAAVNFIVLLIRGERERSSEVKH